MVRLPIWTYHFSVHMYPPKSTSTPEQLYRSTRVVGTKKLLKAYPTKLIRPRPRFERVLTLAWPFVLNWERQA